MPTVYMTQPPGPSINILPARAYGELETVMGAGQLMLDSSAAVRQIKEKLRNFTDKDYILPLGDPAIMMLVGAAAAAINDGVFNILKWDRQERIYYAVKVDLFTEGEL